MRLFGKGFKEWMDAYLASGLSDENAWSHIESETRRRAAGFAAKHGMSEEADDIAQDVLTKLLEDLADVRAGRREPIRDADAFLNARLNNRCIQSIRKRKPLWWTRRDAVMDILSGRRNVQGFAVWQRGQQQLCGFPVWAGQPVQQTKRYVQLNENPRPLRQQVLKQGDPRKLPLHELMQAVFNFLGTPLPVNELVSLLFDLRGEEETAAVSLEETLEVRLPTDDSPEKQVLLNETLDELAEAFATLNREECLVLLCQLSSEEAETLATKVDEKTRQRAPAVDNPHPIEELGCFARHLQMEIEELRQLLDNLPMEDLDIAQLLGIQTDTPKQATNKVAYLRSEARRKIQKYMDENF